MHLIQFVTIFITMWHNEGIPSDVHSSLYLSKKCIYCKNQFIASIFDEDKNCFHLITISVWKLQYTIT